MTVQSSSVRSLIVSRDSHKESKCRSNVNGVWVSSECDDFEFSSSGEQPIILDFNLPSSPPVIQKRKLSTLVTSEKKHVGTKQLSLFTWLNTQTASESSWKKSKSSRFELSPEQATVMKKAVDERKNVFFTGHAGTGKSVLLRHIIEALKKKYRKNINVIAITASTGLAACNIGGTTLHSFAGIGLGDGELDNLVKKIRMAKKPLWRWKQTKVLIIDEISMIGADMFDKLNAIGQKLRGNERPFGGIQLILTGDFMQLPPVQPNGDVLKFCFEAKSWKDCVDENIALTKVFRQNDETFINMLYQLRMGQLTKESIMRFHELKRPLDFADGLLPTQLFATRKEVEEANERHMHELKGKPRTFLAHDTVNVPYLSEASKSALFSNFSFPERLDLKLHSQVMLVKNFDDQLVNGSIGRVIAFMNNKTYRKCLNDGLGQNTIELKYLADPSTDFEQITLSQIEDRDNREHSKDEWPLVRFKLINGFERDFLCQPEACRVESNGEVIASRSQVPLIPAYAISIHKSQGQTLNRVVVDLSRIFENGQAYVALSRATSMEGLQVLNFNPSKVKSHPRVKEFYDSLNTVG